MKSIAKKVYAFLGMMAIMLTAGVSPVFAAVGKNPNDWTGTNSNLNTTGVSNWTDTIINVVSIVGSGIAIIAIIVLGVKYMMGSVEEKAEYKKTLLPYLIGAILVFAASALVGIIYNAAQNA